MSKNAAVIFDDDAREEIARRKVVNVLEERYTDNHYLSVVWVLSPTMVVRLLNAGYVIMPYNEPTIEQAVETSRAHARHRFVIAVYRFLTSHSVPSLVASRQRAKDAWTSLYSKDVQPDASERCLHLKNREWELTEYEQCLEECPHFVRQFWTIEIDREFVAFTDWLAENCQGDCFVTWDGCGFVDERDALHFKMRWQSP